MSLARRILLQDKKKSYPLGLRILSHKGVIDSIIHQSPTLNYITYGIWKNFRTLDSCWCVYTQQCTYRQFRVIYDANFSDSGAICISRVNILVISCSRWAVWRSPDTLYKMEVLLCETILMLWSSPWGVFKTIAFTVHPQREQYMDIL